MRVAPYLASDDPCLAGPWLKPRRQGPILCHDRQWYSLGYSKSRSAGLDSRFAQTCGPFFMQQRNTSWLGPLTPRSAAGSVRR